MNIREYLCAKYETDWPSTMLALEARTFGIPYPLREGWLQVYGERIITASMREQLISKLLNSKKDSAAAGLRALGMATPCEEVKLSDVSFYVW